MKAPVGFGLLLPIPTRHAHGIWPARARPIGPLSIWYVVVLVLGRRAVRAPRKQVLVLGACT